MRIGKQIEIKRYDPRVIPIVIPKTVPKEQPIEAPNWPQPEYVPAERPERQNDQRTH